MKVLESLKGLNIHQINKYTLQRSQDYQDHKVHMPDIRNKPSALSLFPHIGVYNNKQTYTTQKSVEEKDIQRDPMGQDKMKQYHHIMPNDIKTFKNHLILTKPMLLERKFKKIGK